MSAGLPRRRPAGMPHCFSWASGRPPRAGSWLGRCGVSAALCQAQVEDLRAEPRERRRAWLVGQPLEHRAEAVDAASPNSASARPALSGPTCISRLRGATLTPMLRWPESRRRRRAPRARRPPAGCRRSGRSRSRRARPACESTRGTTPRASAVGADRHHAPSPRRRRGRSPASSRPSHHAGATRAGSLQQRRSPCAPPCRRRRRP